MKNLIKTSFIICLSAFLFAACGNQSKESETHAGHDHEAGHVHTYACPMHPEVTGKEGDKCPKCGMLLEHNDEVPVKGNYKMQFTSSPEAIEAGKPVKLIFTPKNTDQPEAAVALDVEHEKKIHLIAVREDLTWFLHTHPEYNADGTYSVTETIPTGGNYILYADYKPSGSTHQLEKIAVKVTGPAAAEQSFGEVRNTSKSDDFTVTLKPDDGKFLSDQAIHFDGVFTKNGKPYDVNDLENYLGAKGHMVGIHAESKEYIHLHPEVENSILHFHTTFENTGMHRVWLQFMVEGKLHTVDFVINVEKGNAAASADHSHSGHSH